jgi:glycogen synthase
MQPAPLSVSVIVNTLNRMVSLENTISALRQLRYPNYEIIVVMGPCADDTSRVLARHRGAIRVGFCTEENLGASRNIGIGLAAGELVAFIDDDAVPEPDWLDCLVQGFSDPNVAAVGGFIRDVKGVLYQRRVTLANPLGDSRNCITPRVTLRSNEYLSPTGTNVAFRSDSLREIGGFDEQYTYFLDETDVNLRLVERGWSIKYVAEAEVHHHYLPNRVRGAKRVPSSRYEIARSKGYFCWKNGRRYHSEAELRAHLNKFRARWRWQLGGYVMSGRVSIRDARRMLAEIDRGVEDGAAAATEQQTAPLAAAPSRMGVTPMPQTGHALENGVRGARVCCVTGLGADAADELEELKALGRRMVRQRHEVTIISAGQAAGAAVNFMDVWHHRIGPVPDTGGRPGGDTAGRRSRKSSASCRVGSSTSLSARRRFTTRSPRFRLAALMSGPPTQESGPHPP